MRESITDYIKRKVSRVLGTDYYEIYHRGQLIGLSYTNKAARSRGLRQPKYATNLNRKGSKIVCRHMVDIYRRKVEAAIKTQSEATHEVKFSDHTRGFETLVDLKRQFEQYPNVDDQEIIAYTEQPFYMAMPDQFGPMLARATERMLVGDIKSIRLNTINHAMHLTVRKKTNPNRFIINIYDPNFSNIEFRVIVDEEKLFSLTIADLFPNNKYRKIHFMINNIITLKDYLPRREDLDFMLSDLYYSSYYKIFKLNLFQNGLAWAFVKDAPILFKKYLNDLFEEYDPYIVVGTLNTIADEDYSGWSALAAFSSEAILNQCLDEVSPEQEAAVVNALSYRNKYGKSGWKVVEQYSGQCLHKCMDLIKDRVQVIQYLMSFDLKDRYRRIEMLIESSYNNIFIESLSTMSNRNVSGLVFISNGSKKILKKCLDYIESKGLEQNIAEALCKINHSGMSGWANIISKRPSLMGRLLELACNTGKEQACIQAMSMVASGDDMVMVVKALTKCDKVLDPDEPSLWFLVKQYSPEFYDELVNCALGLVDLHLKNEHINHKVKRYIQNSMQVSQDMPVNHAELNKAVALLNAVLDPNQNLAERPAGVLNYHGCTSSSLFWQGSKTGGKSLQEDFTQATLDAEAAPAMPCLIF